MFRLQKFKITNINIKIVFWLEKKIKFRKWKENTLITLLKYLRKSALKGKQKLIKRRYKTEAVAKNI